jgi:hypothetical protein
MRPEATPHLCIFRFSSINNTMKYGGRTNFSSGWSIGANYEVVSKIFRTGAAIYTAVVVAQRICSNRPYCQFRVLLRRFAATALKTYADVAPNFGKNRLKGKNKLKGRRFDTTVEIQAESQRVLALWQKRTSRKRSKNGGDGGTGVYMREGTTSRFMAADRPYVELYDFYSVSRNILDRPS